MHIWKEALDQVGDATYSIDYDKEMIRLGHTLSSVVVTLSQAAIDAGLVKASESITGNTFSLKFSIPNVNDQIFSKKGLVLPMEITYTTSGGEKDNETFKLIVKDK